MNIFMLLPMIAVGLTVLGMVVFLFVKSGKTGRWCILGSIVLLPVLFVMFFVPVRVVRHPVLNIQETSAVNLSEIESAPIWTEGIEDQFEADVYPSKQSAIKALEIRTKGQGGADFNAVDLETHTAPWSGGFESKQSSGKIEASVTVGEGQNAIIANFVEKPWVENLADFVNRNPKNKWILARSQHSCTTQAEAEQQAMSDACKKIANLLNQVRQRGSGFTVNPIDLRSGGFIADKFVQSFDGAAGRIWRQAILIDASQDKLARLAHQKQIAHQSWRTRWLREIASVFGLALLICVVYLFLNAATRGYYTWSLRIAAVVLIAAVILLMFRFF